MAAVLGIAEGQKEGEGGCKVVKPCRERHNECNAEIRRLNLRTSEREKGRAGESAREPRVEKAETERNRGESERSNGMYIYSPNFLD